MSPHENTLCLGNLKYAGRLFLQLKYSQWVESRFYFKLKNVYWIYKNILGMIQNIKFKDYNQISLDTI